MKKQNLESVRVPGRLVLALCLALALGWTSWTSALLAQRWQWGENASYVSMGIAQLLAVPLMAALLWCAWWLVQHKEKTWRWSLIFIGYWAAFSILFLVTAPGCLTEDSFYSFHMVGKGWWGNWYSPLHPALLTAWMQIVPWQWNGPGLGLALNWAGVFALLHWLLWRDRAPAWWHGLLPLLLLTPVQVQGAVLILRDSFFSAMWVLWLLGLWLLVRRRAPLHPVALSVMSLWGGLAMVYRTDAIPGVLPGLMVLWFLTARRARQAGAGSWLRCARRSGHAVLWPCLAALVFGMLPAGLMGRHVQIGNHWEDRVKYQYKLTLMENPLGYIVRQPEVHLTDAQRSAIERVFRIEDLRQHYCAGNICTFHGGFWNKESSRQQRDAAFSAALQVFAQYPGLFLRSRWDTLDSVGLSSSQTRCSIKLRQERGYAMAPSFFGFGSAHDAVMDWLRASEGPMGARWWWNVPLFACLALAVMLCWRRAPASALVATLLLLRTFAVFLAAPAGFTVYYMPLFVMAPMLLLLCILEWMRRSGEVCGVGHDKGGRGLSGTRDATSLDDGALRSVRS